MFTLSNTRQSSLISSTNYKFDFLRAFILESKCAQTGSLFHVHREIFELDNYSPIPVDTEEEYKLVTSRFPYHDAEIEKVTD